MSDINPAEAARLRTWAVDIAMALLPEGAARTIEGADTKFSKSSGLCINSRNGAWYAHAAGKGGWGTRGLIEYLRQCSTEEATVWAQAWLTEHPGIGSCNGQDNDTDAAGAAALASAEYARTLLSSAVAVDGTAGEAYLRSRALPPPYPPCVKFVPNVRTGEHGLLGILTARERIVGAQILYIAPDGAKSLVPPQRRVFLLDRTAGREGAFAVRAPDGPGGLLKTVPTLVLVEGLENALSVAEATVAPLIAGIPGIGRLQHVKVKEGHQIVIFRDGDRTGSPADKALIAGVDALLLAGAEVRITATPAGGDANSILQASGPATVAELLRQATATDDAAAKLSRDGEVKRLARLDDADYDMERHSAAKRFGLRVGTLDSLVVKARPKAATGDASLKAADEAPWEGDVDLCAVLDAALVELQRYVVAPVHSLGTIVVWGAHTHIVHSDLVRLQKSPRLAIHSRMPGSGKTTTLDFLRALSRRARTASSFTASSVLRGMDARKPTLLLDEADGVLKDRKSDLVTILNAGDRRSSAFVERSVPTPDGGWETREFNVWGAVAIAGIDELPPTLHDRSVRIWLERVLAKNVAEQMRDGTSPTLVELRRQLAAWGEQLVDLPDPELPEALRYQPARLSDNWRPIAAIAQLAGGQWPDLIAQAIETAIKEEQRPTQVARLLRSTRRAFDLQAETDADALKLAEASPVAAKAYSDRADNAYRLTTPTLLACLLREEEEEWSSANRGRPVTPYYLRHQLRHLLKPEGSTDWWSGPAGGQKHHSGYLRAQFEVAWATIIPRNPMPPLPPLSPQSGVSGVSGGDGLHDAETGQTGGFPTSAPTPDHTPDPSGAGLSGVETRPLRPVSPDTLDTPDHRERVDAGEAVAPMAEPQPGSRKVNQPEVVGTKAATKRRAAFPASQQSVREARIKHPEWSTKRLARSLGLTEAVVLRALKGLEPLPTGEAPSVDNAEGSQ